MTISSMGIISPCRKKNVFFAFPCVYFPVIMLANKNNDKNIQAAVQEISEHIPPPFYVEIDILVENHNDGSGSETGYYFVK